jgi:hypothetical protein
MLPSPSSCTRDVLRRFLLIHNAYLLSLLRLQSDKSMYAHPFRWKEHNISLLHSALLLDEHTGLASCTTLQNAGLENERPSHVMCISEHPIFKMNLRVHSYHACFRFGADAISLTVLVCTELKTMNSVQESKYNQVQILKGMCAKVLLKACVYFVYST